MKVGIIGLGRMGEGMSRRMLKEGIETYGYRRNYAKAQEAADNGYITAVLQILWKDFVQVVKGDGNRGIFQLVIPAELVEDTIDELLPLLGIGDIIIDHGNSNFKDSRRKQSVWKNWDPSNILIVVLVVVFTVWTVDTVLWLAVQILQYPLALQSLGHSHQVSGLTHRTDPFSEATSAEYGWLHCGGPGAGHFVKMVHNGIEYGIMQAYAEGFNILKEANAGTKYVKEGDAEVAPMEFPENYMYDIDVAEGG